MKTSIVRLCFSDAANSALKSGGFLSDVVRLRVSALFTTTCSAVARQAARRGEGVCVGGGGWGDASSST